MSDRYLAAIEVVPAQTPAGAVSLQAHWAAASRSLFPLPLDPGDELRLTVAPAAGVTEAQITRVRLERTADDLDLTAGLQVTGAPGATVSLVDVHRDRRRQGELTVFGSASYQGQVLEWSTDPEIILRSGMQGGM